VGPGVETLQAGTDRVLKVAEERGGALVMFPAVVHLPALARASNTGWVE
jgi:hypothetical protein